MPVSLHGTHPRRRGPKRKYDGKVDWQDLSRFDNLGTIEGQAHLHLYTAVVWHKSLKRCLRVVVLLNRQDPAKPRHIILASTDLELDGHKMVEYYGARFQIEFLFRDGKQSPAFQIVSHASAQRSIFISMRVWRRSI